MVSNSSVMGTLAHGQPQQLGVLVPVESVAGSGSTEHTIVLFEGINSIGRKNLATNCKHVSRKHISIHASKDGVFQVTAEGLNSIVVRTGMVIHEMKPQEKRIIHDGDVLELIPGKYAFRLIGNSDKNLTVVAEKKPFMKRKRHELGDESLLRGMEDGKTQNSHGEGSLGSSSKLLKSAGKNGNHESCVYTESNQCRTIEGFDPNTFQLLKVTGLPNWANIDCIGIQDVIKDDVEFAMISNYMIDVEWLLSACPVLQQTPNVVLIHGESGDSVELLKARKPPRWQLHKPPLPISYGTHHSKAMLLIHPTRVRIVVHTANLIYVDWNNKTQGLWMQDFPYKDEVNKGRTSPFEEDLIEYLEALQWKGCMINHQRYQNTCINAKYFRNFDYTSAKVRLIASVPGYHRGRELEKWGHMKLRRILQEQQFEEIFIKSPLVYQFSSLGSLDEKWLEEFADSTSAGKSYKCLPLGVGNFQILWPTVEDVRCSLEGYAAGNAIPSPLKNVEKYFLKKYWAKWHADHTGRRRAMPHIKSYLRYFGQQIAWFLLTSANLSKAAWGALQKNGCQLMIRSYELGVLFLPSIQNVPSNFSCTNRNLEDHELRERKAMANTVTKKFFTTFSQTEEDKGQTCDRLFFPVPFEIPPQNYVPEDVPWSWDRQYSKPDVYGEFWPRLVKLYGHKN